MDCAQELALSACTEPVFLMIEKIIRVSCKNKTMHVTYCNFVPG